MILPPDGTRVDSLKLKVIGTFVFEAIRCDEEMLKDKSATCPRMAPERIFADGSVSEDVRTFTPSVLATTAPI